APGRDIGGSSTVSPAAEAGRATSMSISMPWPTSRTAVPAGPTDTGCRTTVAAKGSLSTTRCGRPRSGSTIACTFSLEADGVGHVDEEAAEATGPAAPPFAHRGRRRVVTEAVATAGVPERRPLGRLGRCRATHGLGDVGGGRRTVDGDRQVR